MGLEHDCDLIKNVMVQNQRSTCLGNNNKVPQQLNAKLECKRRSRQEALPLRTKSYLHFYKY